MGRDSEFIGLVAGIGLLVGMVPATRWFARRTEGLFLASFEGDPDHGVIHTRPPTIGSKRRPGLQVTPDDVNDFSCWRVTARDVSLGNHTTLSLCHVGIFGRPHWRSDVMTGDFLFDQKLRRSRQQS